MMEDPQVEGEEQEEQQAPQETKVKPLVKVVSPMETPDFDRFTEIYMGRRNITDKTQARMQLVKMFSGMGSDDANLEEVKATVKNITNLLDQLPETEGTKRVKDTIGAQTAMWGKEKLMKGGDDRTEMVAIMKELLPLKLRYKMMNDMFKDDDNGGGKTQKGPDSESEALREVRKLRQEHQDERRAKEQQEQLERHMQPMRDGLQKLTDSVNQMQKNATEGRNQPTNVVPPAMQQQINNLQEQIAVFKDALADRENIIRDSKLKDDILSTVGQKLDSIIQKGEKGEKGGGMEDLKTLVETLKAIGVPIGASSGGIPLDRLPTWAMLVRDPEFRKGMREMSAEMVEDFTGAIMKGIGGVGGGEAIERPPSGFKFEKSPLPKVEAQQFNITVKPGEAKPEAKPPEEKPQAPPGVRAELEPEKPGGEPEAKPPEKPITPPGGFSKHGKKKPEEKVEESKPEAKPPEKKPQAPPGVRAELEPDKPRTDAGDSSSPPMGPEKTEPKTEKPKVEKKEES